MSFSCDIVGQSNGFLLRKEILKRRLYLFVILYLFDTSGFVKCVTSARGLKTHTVSFFLFFFALLFDVVVVVVVVVTTRCFANSVFYFYVRWSSLLEHHQRLMMLPSWWCCRLDDVFLRRLDSSSSIYLATMNKNTRFNYGRCSYCCRLLLDMQDRRRPNADQ